MCRVITNDLKLTVPLLTLTFIQKHYDLIVYGSCVRGMPFYNNISRLYDADRIILLNGEDTFGEAGRPWERGNQDRSKIDMYLAKGHLLFIREMEHYK